MSRAKVKRALLDHLAENYPFQVPAGMVDLEFEAIWKQLKQEMERGGEAIAEGKSEEELKEEYRTIAERRVRLGLILSDIGQKNELKVEQHELNAAIMDQARRYPGQEQKVLDFFRNNPSAVDHLRAPLYEDKVVDFILQMANVTERQVTPEELMADPDAEGRGGGGAAAAVRPEAWHGVIRSPAEVEQANEPADQPVDPDGGRADQPRRTRLRHLFAPAQGADHVSGRPGARRGGEPDPRAAPVPGGREPDKDISFYINSPGGVVTAGLAIYDTMQYIRPPVSTLCIGQAASMGSLLLAAGAPGKRFCLPQRQHHDSSAFGRRPRAGHRHRDPGARDPEVARASTRCMCATPGRRSRSSRPPSSATSFHVAARSQGVRPG